MHFTNSGTMVMEPSIGSLQRIAGRRKTPGITMDNSSGEVEYEFTDEELPVSKLTTKKRSRKGGKRSTPRISEYSSGKLHSYEHGGYTYYQVRCPGCTHKTVGCLNAVGAQATLREHIRTHHLSSRHSR